MPALRLSCLSVVLASRTPLRTGSHARRMSGFAEVGTVDAARARALLCHQAELGAAIKGGTEVY